MAFSGTVRDKIIRDNLGMQEAEISAIAEARLSHLSDIARSLVLSLSPDKSTLDALVNARQTLSPTAGAPRLHKEALPSNIPLLETVFSCVTAADEALFTMQLCRHLATADREITLYDFLPPPEEGGRIAYVGSSFTHDAYSLFSEKLDSPRVVYCEDFEGACAAVAAQDAEYCILPFRDAGGRRVRTAAALMEAYHLTVCDAVAIYDGEDEGREYALCGKAPLPLFDSYLLWLTLPSEAADSVLLGARYLGLSLQEATIESDCNLCFAGEGDPTPVLLWLTLFHAPYRVEGLYNNFEKEK